MRVPIEDLQFALTEFPNVPCSVYFYNDQMEVEPKRIFTITKKQINHEKNQVELFVMELGKFVPNSDRIDHIRQVNPN